MGSYKSLETLHFFLKIFSLHCISYESKQGFISTPWSHLKATIMLFIFGSLLSYNQYIHYFGVFNSKISPSVFAVDTVNSLLGYFAYIVDLYFIYKYRNDMCAYYNNYDQMDAVLKMKYMKNIKILVTKMLVILLSSWFIASVGQFVVWALAKGLLAPCTYSFSYFMLLVRYLTAMDFITQTMHIRLRLKCITDHIEEFASFCDNSANRIKTIRSQTEKENKLMPCISKCRCEIGKVSSCYLLLIGQAKFLNIVFGVRMLIYCLYTLSEFITFVNFAARFIRGGLIIYLLVFLIELFRLVHTVITSHVLLTPNVLRFINGVVVLATVVHYSEACCQECGDIIDATDRLLVHKIISDDIKHSLKTLRKLVTSRPLKFSAAGFFNLESTLLLSTASVVITYALVIVQIMQ